MSHPEALFSIDFPPQVPYPIPMNNLLIQLCTSLLIGQSPNQACHTALPQAYTQSGAFYSLSQSEESDLRKESLDIYNKIPYNQYIVAMVAGGVLMSKANYSTQVSGPLWASYSSSTYKLELKWRF